MRVEHRIPTILGILIIIISLAATVFLFKNARSFLGRASQDATPAEVKITNISESGFTVSWVSAGKVAGTVSFGQDPSLGKIATDDRDQVSGKTDEYTTHHVTLRYLKPDAKYYFKIISGGGTFDNNGEPYIVTTAKEIGPSSSQAQPIYGTVTKIDGSPAAGTIVYLNLVTSTPLSTLVKSSGSWLITLNNARTVNLSDFVKIKGDEKIEIFVQGGKEGTTQALTTLTNDLQVPQITLGKTYDFRQATPTPIPPLSTTPTARPSTGFKPPEVATPSPTLLTPASGSAIPSDRPIFKGTGIPGTIVTIKIESPAPVTGTTTVDQNGNWSWTPPASLTPEEHTVVVSTTDSNNKPVQFTRKFTVLASGTQVTEAATPSATVKPSPTPSPSPTPTATLSAAPPSGNLTPTILALLLGLTFLVLGFGKLFFLDKP